MASDDEDEYTPPANTNTEDDFPREGWLPHAGDDQVITRNIWTEAGIVATEGRIIAHVPPKDRRPALYQWESLPSPLTREMTIQILTQGEIKSNTIATSAAVSPSDYQNHMLSQVQERLASNLHDYTVASVLPDCFLHALLEEAWFHFLQRESAALAAGVTPSAESSATLPSRASYYATSYVAPPTTTLQEQQEQAVDPNLYFTVSSLHQRIKVGTQLAHQYMHAYSNYQASLTADNFSSLRRSRRIPKPDRPNPYQKGGKIAYYLLERCMENEKEDNGKENNGNEKETKVKEGEKNDDIVMDDNEETKESTRKKKNDAIASANESESEKEGEIKVEGSALLDSKDVAENGGESKGNATTPNSKEREEKVATENRDYDKLAETAGEDTKATVDDKAAPVPPISPVEITEEPAISKEGQLSESSDKAPATEGTKAEKQGNDQYSKMVSEDGADKPKTNAEVSQSTTDDKSGDIIGDVEMEKEESSPTTQDGSKKLTSDSNVKEDGLSSKVEGENADNDSKMKGEDEAPPIKEGKDANSGSKMEEGDAALTSTDGDKNRNDDHKMEENAASVIKDDDASGNDDSELHEKGAPIKESSNGDSEMKEEESAPTTKGTDKDSDKRGTKNVDKDIAQATKGDRKRKRDTREDAEVEEKEEVILINAHEEEIESEEDDADKDDDFETNDEMDEDEDDDELQGVVQQRDQLDIDFDGLQRDGEENNEEEDEDDDEGGDYVSTNPFLQPSPESALDWLGRRGKSMGIPELQEAIGLCIKQSLGLYDLSSMDQLAIIGNSNSRGETFVLDSIEKWKDLKKYDAATFARCKFRLKSDTEEEQQWFRQQELEDKHRKEKAWASWRFKGIHSGYTIWPSWVDSADEWIKDKKGDAPQPPEAMTPSEDPSGEGDTNDLALAQSLAAVTPGRRSARRANTTNDAVFYGSQTQMSQKQLMETLVRLCKQSSYHTLLGLQTLVGEDSTNPVHRLRISVGRLVWKRNQLIRQRVTSVWSDQPLWNSLQSAPLWTIEDDDSLDEDTKACANALVDYLRQLQQTELQLRNIVLRQLTHTSIPGVATAADERVGTLESFDSSDFEVPENIEWKTAGHDYLGTLIFRPGQQPATEYLECRWYKIKDYVDSVAYDGPIDEKNDNGATLAERRMRFRAIPRDGHGEALILTEAQVAAGHKAAEQAKERSSKTGLSEHPFVGGVGTQVTLKAATDTMQCVVVGYDAVSTEPREEGQARDRQHRALLLPEARGSEKVAFWTTVFADVDGNLSCRMVDASEPITYKIEQSDYELQSSAFRACQGVVKFLSNHKHAGIFMEPVDPAALNIPTYFDVVKQPMDISTLSENLEKGLYSKIPPTKSVGRSAVSRMLNGPFKDDALLIFDNAILFNPPDDWIHQTAKSIRKSVIKKIEQAIIEAEHGGSSSRRVGHKSNSVYVDEDSDVDMYEYESDRDDEDFTSGKRAKKRKRKSGANKDDVSTKATQGPVRLQGTLSETLGLRGPFAKLPIISDASGFSLRPDWGCRNKVKKRTEKQKVKDDQAREELKEILKLQRQAEESDRASLRRSARAPILDDQTKSSSCNSLAGKVSYHLLKPLPALPKTLPAPEMAASSRTEIENLLEQAHETYYAKLHQQMHRHLGSDSRNGLFANASFPPYLGRILPTCLDGDEPTWEIRSEYIVPAVRWVIRGLVQSGHLIELEPLTVDAPFTSGVIMTSDIYYHDPANHPFHLLEIRRKKKDDANDESSEDEIELSEYEKLRAERVARNAERLKMLGLA